MSQIVLQRGRLPGADLLEAGSILGENLAPVGSLMVDLEGLDHELDNVLDSYPRRRQSCSQDLGPADVQSTAELNMRVSVMAAPRRMPVPVDQRASIAVIEGVQVRGGGDFPAARVLDESISMRELEPEALVPRSNDYPFLGERNYGFGSRLTSTARYLQHAARDARNGRLQPVLELAYGFVGFPARQNGRSISRWMTRTSPASSSSSNSPAW